MLKSTGWRHVVATMMLARESHRQRLRRTAVETRRVETRYTASLLTLIVVMLALAACSANTPMSMPASAPAAGAPTGQGASATAGALQINDAWARAAAEGMTGAVYFTVRNTGSTPDRLIKAQSSVAKSVETHTTVMKDNVMSMQPVDGYDIPPGGELVLKPGGNHIMLVGMNKDVKADESVTLTLQFEKAGPVDITVKARQP
ncbi:MAG: copper chaperone PCu(A)C [Anaerolineae bacterium]